MSDSQRIFDSFSELLTQSLQGNSSAQSQIRLHIEDKKLSWGEAQLIIETSEEAIKQKNVFGYTLRAMMHERNGDYPAAISL